MSRSTVEMTIGKRTLRLAGWKATATNFAIAAAAAYGAFDLADGVIRLVRYLAN